MSLKRLLLTLTLASACIGTVVAQEYESPEVKVSTDKVKVNGKTYLAHVVTGKQTLFSISKAYGVSLNDIYSANPNLHLKEEGLKAGQVLLVPVVSTENAPTSDSSGSERAAETVDLSGSDSSAAKDNRSGGPKWLFPGKRKASNDAAIPDTLSQRPPSPAAEIEVPVSDTSVFILDVPARIKVALMLPFSNGKLSDNAVDFYSGALLAARDLGNSGIALDINAVDIRDSTQITPFVLSAYDVIIGPVSAKDMKAVLAKCPQGKYVISPLDPQAAWLAAEHPSIQAPTPVRTQNEEVVEWVLRDMTPSDSLVLLTSRASRQLSPGSAALVNALNASGRKYHQIRYDIHDGASIQRAFMSHASANGTTRYIIADDEESFVSDAIRNINLMAFKKYDVALYAPSRVRNYSYIEAENLHNVNTHVCTAYFTDYASEAVGNFVFAYRALFGAEPNSFAFHGYDTMHYFANICRIYGRMWPMRLEDYTESGLQTSFSFAREEGSQGYVNRAVRRLVYTPDFRIQQTR